MERKLVKILKNGTEVRVLLSDQPLKLKPSAEFDSEFLSPLVTLLEYISFCGISFLLVSYVKEG